MSDLLFLKTEGEFTRFLDGRSTEIPRSFDWCIRKALNPSASISHLVYAPHSFTPKALNANLQKIARADGTIFCVGANVLVPLSKWAGLLRGRLVVLLWSLPRPGALRRALFKCQLDAAVTLAVNDSETGRQLKLEWPEMAAKVVFVTHPVDTKFFYPPKNRTGEFILVPGDKDRDEEFVLQLASTSELPVVRVTREPKVKRFYEDHNCDPLRLKVMFRVTFPELRELYQRAKAVVLPVMNQRHPAGLNSLLEGMACGCPCLVACGKTTADYAQDGRTAIFLQGTRSEMVQQVRAALGSPGRLEEIGQAGYQRVAQNLSPDQLVPEWGRLVNP